MACPKLIASFCFALTFAIFSGHNTAQAQNAAFKLALAEAVVSDREIAKFYKDTGYAPVFTADDLAGKQRRQALIQAFETASAHGIPAQEYDANTLRSMIAAAKQPDELGTLEGKLARIFLSYAQDIQTGVVVPARVDSEIKREVPYRGRYETMAAFSQASPRGFINALPPKSPEYARLMKEKLRLEHLIGTGGWGPKVAANALKPGAQNNSVLALRNRLIAMGFMERSTSKVYDDTLTQAVRQFQEAHGLEVDGEAGASTILEINIQPEQRLTQVIVAMERERWMNRTLGERHIWVNLTDFSAKVVDDGKVTFQTRSVIGANKGDRRSPEFSDVMEHMVINPSWYVPRSIATKEYLPKLQRNPYAVSHLVLTDARGRTINRGSVNFSKFSARTFPFNMRQPPSRGNALGLVKFMFPNKYNIYLHDTPAKNLFSREVRAFSHGCIRLNDPFDFAYALLAKQTSDPKGFFQSRLNSGSETRVDLEAPVPVHLVYRTAFTSPGGVLNYRRDVYGRDAKIWQALRQEGVVLRSIGG